MKLKRGMHDSERSTNRSFDMSNKAFASNLCSASTIFTYPQSTLCIINKEDKRKNLESFVMFKNEWILCNDIGPKIMSHVAMIFIKVQSSLMTPCFILRNQTNFDYKRKIEMDVITGISDSIGYSSSLTRVFWVFECLDTSTRVP